jgi:hypothetical protein
MFAVETLKLHAALAMRTRLKPQAGIHLVVRITESLLFVIGNYSIRVGLPVRSECYREWQR